MSPQNSREKPTGIFREVSFASKAERFSISGWKAMAPPYLCSEDSPCRDSVASCARWFRSHDTIAQMSSSFRSAPNACMPPSFTPGRPSAGFTSLPPLRLVAVARGAAVRVPELLSLHDRRDRLSERVRRREVHLDAARRAAVHGLAEREDVGDEPVHLGLALHRLRRAGDVLVGVRDADAAERAHRRLDLGAVDRLAVQERVRRHVRARHELLRALEVLLLPGRGRLDPALEREVRARPLRPPEERVVVGELAREGVARGRLLRAVPAVADHLALERSDRLRVAGVAALALVDVAPGELERRERLQARDLHVHVGPDERVGHHDDGADEEGGGRHHRERDGLRVDLSGHGRPPYAAVTAAGATGASLRSSARPFRIVMSTLKTKNSMPTAKMIPASVRVCQYG